MKTKDVTLIAMTWYHLRVQYAFSFVTRGDL